MTIPSASTCTTSKGRTQTTSSDSPKRWRCRRELYLRRKANGVCVCCKSRKAEEGKVKCRECARKQHIVYMRNRVLRVRPDGQCIRCEDQARPGSKLCEKHYAEAVKQCAYMRAKANPKAHVWHADNAIVFQAITHKEH